METIAMGGYGVYVWSSYALTLAVFVFNAWRAQVRHRAIYRDVEVRIKVEESL